MKFTQWILSLLLLLPSIAIASGDTKTLDLTSTTNVFYSLPRTL